MDRLTGDGGVTLDRLFRALSHPTRRRILASILEREEEFGAADFLPRSETRDRIRMQLHHTHLPLLDEAGFIEWDHEADAVTRGPRFEEIEDILTLMADAGDEHPDDWP